MAGLGTEGSERTALLAAIHAATVAMAPDSPTTRLRKAMDRLSGLLAERDLRLFCSTLLVLW